MSATERVIAYLDELDRLARITGGTGAQQADTVHAINDLELTRSDLRQVIAELEDADAHAKVNAMNFADYQQAQEDARQARAELAGRPVVEPEECPDCGSTTHELVQNKFTRSTAPDGRLRMHDVTVHVAEVCSSCSFAFQSIDLDDFLAKITNTKENPAS